jgi:DNA-binding NarL/FixJ family response regulator
MQQWFIDGKGGMLPAWREAFPEAKCLSREDVPALGSSGVLWCRVRAGESLADVLANVPPQAQRFLVLLCDEPEDALVMDALAAGAAGCCNTHAAPAVLQQVALVVGNGGLWVGQSLLQKLVGTTARILGQRPPAEAADSWAKLLSEREAQVARLVAGGASNKEIASQLEITERTVKAHLSAIFEKLGVRDRLQLSLRINGLNI